MPAEEPQRSPDAVILPAGAGGNAQIQEAVRKILGSGQAYVRNQVSYNFVTLKPDDTMVHPKGHPRVGQPRYDWYEKGNGVKFGYLRADDLSEPVPTEGAILAGLEQFLPAEKTP